TGVQTCALPIFAFGICREDYRTITGPHRIQVDEPTDCSRQHHTGQIVALEYVGPFEESSGNHQAACTGFDNAFVHARFWSALDNGDPIIVVAGSYRGI